MLGSIAALLLSAASAQAAYDYDATICGQKMYGDVTKSLMYNANAWNPKSPDDGFVCVKVDNSTPAFDATWNWDQDIQDVHSFPYVRFGSLDLPMRLSSLSSIRLSTDWVMTAGSPSEPPRTFTNSALESNAKALDKNKAQANAAWDFFLDSDRNRTLYPQDAAIEMMVWLGSVGDPWWLGREENTILSNITLGKTEFSLYYGRNSGGTHVFTAVPSDGEDVPSLDADFYPLFDYLLNEAPDHPDTPDDLPKDPWLGIVEFGSETWFSEGNVTFTAANFAMQLNEESGGNSTSGSGDDDKDDDDDDDNGAGVARFPLFGYFVTAGLILGVIFA
ncbi:concanavalin A-like lectin/glucanase domain-containing protein [Thelonectria olida]|uniref:Concanavalin A-like lectin/glucanase domain-containing protein n=1 Tax=Thelonectria olida TaxID=1576542 RepID=A0A9P9ATA9_9HYPO|nr:concanavalin A-like lectin/glucanase domain-containing protein [Thelonectria olida]